jgi:hypothetical protein
VEDVEDACEGLWNHTYQYAGSQSSRGNTLEKKEKILSDDQGASLLYLLLIKQRLCHCPASVSLNKTQRKDLGLRNNTLTTGLDLLDANNQRNDVPHYQTFRKFQIEPQWDITTHLL